MFEIWMCMFSIEDADEIKTKSFPINTLCAFVWLVSFIFEWKSPDFGNYKINWYLAKKNNSINWSTDPCEEEYRGCEAKKNCLPVFDKCLCFNFQLVHLIMPLKRNWNPIKIKPLQPSWHIAYHSEISIDIKCAGVVSNQWLHIPWMHYLRHWNRFIQQCSDFSNWGFKIHFDSGLFINLYGQQRSH